MSCETFFKVQTFSECVDLCVGERRNIINVIYGSELGFEMEIKPKLIHNALLNETHLFADFFCEHFSRLF